MIKILTARWVLPVTAPPFENGALAIDRDRIVGVGDPRQLSQQFPEAHHQSFGNAALLPGFINTHSHLELTAFRGRLEEPLFQPWIASLIRLKAERLDFDDLLFSARLGCLEAIRAGITTLADTSDASAPREALIESGLRGIIFQECFGPFATQADESLAALQKKIEHHQQRLAGTSSTARIGIGVSPHAPYSVSSTLYQKVARLAVTESFDLAIHTAESQDEQKFLRDGSGAFGDAWRRRGIEFIPPTCSTIEYFAQLGVLEAAPLLVHCVMVNETDLSLIAQATARIAHCPKSNAKFGHGLAPLPEMLAHKIAVGVGTDGVGSNNSGDLLEEARFGALLQRATRRDATLFSAEKILRLLTIEGARALRLDQDIGSLEVGKKADLIAIDLSQVHQTPFYDPATAIVFSCSGRDVIHTMVAGQTLYEKGLVKSLDETAVIQAVRKTQNKLAKS